MDSKEYHDLTLEELLVLVEKKYPDCAEWLQLKKVIKSGTQCFCCGKQKAKAYGLCEKCLIHFHPTPAIVVDNICDCGHKPQGEYIYTHLYEPNRPTLCGAKCVRQKWKAKFGIFLAILGEK